MADPAGNHRKAVLRAVLFIVCLLPFLFLVSSYWGSGYDAGSGDYAQYLLHAKTILEGRPYTDIGYIYSQKNPVIGPRAYSPGLPLSLAAASYLFGWNDSVHAAVILLGALTFLLFVGLYFNEIEGSRIAPLVILICGLAPGWARSATLVGSDLIFCALVWAIIYLIDSTEDRRPGQLVLLSAVGAGAVIFRPAGVVLIPAALGFALMHRRSGQLRLLFPAAFWALTFVAVNAILPVTTSYADQVAFDLSAALRTAFVNLWTYRLAVFESHLYPFVEPRLSDAYHLTTSVLMGVGLISWFPRLKNRFLFAFCFWYVLVHLAFTETVARYFWPLFPVFAFGLLVGLQQALSYFLGNRLKETTARWVVWATVGIVAVMAIGWNFSSPRPRAFDAEAEVRELVDRTRSMGQGARVAFFNPRFLTLSADVPAMGLFVGTPPEVVEELCSQGITHAITGDFGTKEPGHASLLAAIEQLPDFFDLTWENGAFAVYVLDRPACAILIPSSGQDPVLAMNE